MNKITDNDIHTIDCVNLGVGTLIILSALFALWNGEAREFMFPVIFLLGAYMNCMWGIKKVAKSKVAAVCFFGIGIALCLLAVGLMI